MTLSTQVDPVLSRERKFFISGFMWRDTARVAFLSIFSSKPGTPTGNQQPHHQRLATTIYRMPVLDNHTTYSIYCSRFDILLISHVISYPILYKGSQYSVYLTASRTLSNATDRCCYFTTIYTIHSVIYIYSLLSLVLLYLVLLFLFITTIFSVFSPLYPAAASCHYILWASMYLTTTSRTYYI